MRHGLRSGCGQHSQERAQACGAYALACMFFRDSDRSPSPASLRACPPALPPSRELVEQQYDALGGAAALSGASLEQFKWALAVREA